MADIKNQKVIWAKGILFLFLGLFSSLLLVLETSSMKVVLLLLVSIWAFCRCYYFVFYVIEHYVDSDYRFSGLLSFFQYMLRRWRGGI
jgi:hypothetical protein